MAAEAHDLFCEGKFAAAIQKYTALMKAGTDVNVHRCNRARSYLRLQVYNKALKDADEVLRQDPNAAEAVLIKAEALLAISKTSEAREVCRHFLPTITRVDVYQRLRAILNGETASSSGAPSPSAPAGPPAEAAPSPPAEAAAAAAAPAPAAPAANADPAPEKEGKPAPPPAAAATAKPRAKEFPLEVLNNPVVTAAMKGTNVTHGVGDLDTDKLIALGYYWVNNGLHPKAIAHFGDMLAKRPNLIAALIGRGTALALSGQFLASENDFTKALLLQPQMADGYRRRAQVLGAQGKTLEAISDLSTAIKIEPNVADSYFQRGTILHKLGENTESLQDLKKAVELESGNRHFLNYLGLVHNSLGECMEALAAFEKSLAVDPDWKETYYGMGMALRDWGRAEEALRSFSQAIERDPEFVNAIHLRSFLYFNTGRHALAVKDSTRVVELDPKHKEGLFLKAMAYHDLGQFQKAVQSYDVLLKYYQDDVGWYNREMALTLHHLLDKPARERSLDDIFDPDFKECWCKRMDPTKAKLGAHRRQPPLDPAVPDVPIGKAQPPKSEPALALLHAADEVGRALQLRTQGFVPNVRQHRMCGLAVLEAAQAARDYWDGKAELSWRGLMDTLVRWRQLSENNDPVWWVDKLPEELFFEGYGLQTPMVTGQMKVPKYYPYFERCFNITKTLTQEQHVLTDTMAEAVKRATTCAELWKALQHDFFVISPCYRLPLEAGEGPADAPRAAAERGWMEGTRITLVQKPEERGYQFTIRTAGTPYRYREFYKEMDLLWARIAAAARDPNCPPDRLADCIVSLYFIWVNFQPLTRGSAACGVMVLLALFLAAGERLETVANPGVQMDWEGITTPLCRDFLDRMTPWLYQQRRPSALLEGLPRVAEVFCTFRQCLEALNHDLA